jgi:diacylglycerol kinase family enzyme
MSIAVLINANARRGGSKVASWVSELLPSARLKLTHSADESRRWLKEELRPHPPELLLGGGGDGTMIGLLNELRDLGMPFPALGVLPLGTGNAWAGVTGAPSPKVAMRRLAQLGQRTPPVRTFSLVETEGRLCHFAGTGWDAEMINDFHTVKRLQPPGLREANAGLLGYLNAMFTRTVPRALLRRDAAQVVVRNLGLPALTVNAQGEVSPMGLGAGEVLYSGRASVAAASSTTDWGFGFKAFPYAHAAPGRLSARVYSAGVLEAVSKSVRLFRGGKVSKMHDFLLSHGRMEFDRPVPLQLGGDLAGLRESFEFRIAEETVDLLQWRALA